jgi:outer membrane protein assembly factor BamB
MRTLHKLLLCLYIVILPHVALGASWNMYLWDPSHSSFNPAESLIDGNSVKNLGPIASFRADGGFAAAPVVVDGTAYVGDWSGRFYAIRATEGRTLWRQFVGMAANPGNSICQPAVGVSGQAVVSGNVVYVPGGDSAVYALDRQTGAQLWRVPLADPAAGAYLWSSLTLVNNSLYVGVSSLGDCPIVRGAVARIDLANPQKPAFFYLDPPGKIGGGVWSTPAVDTDTNTVYFTSGNGDFDPAAGLWSGTLMTLDASTLAPGNHFEIPSNDPTLDMDWGSSPTLFQSSNGTPLVAATGKDGVLYCLNRNDLSQVWSTQVAQSCDCPECGCGSVSTPAFDGQRLYLGAGTIDWTDRGSVYAIDPSSGQTIWVRSLPGTVLAPVTVVNGVVFASTLTGLMAFDAATGETLWDDSGRGALFSQPVVVDGLVYSTYVSGELVIWGLPNGNPPDPIPRPRGPRR